MAEIFPDVDAFMFIEFGARFTKVNKIQAYAGVHYFDRNGHKVCNFPGGMSNSDGIVTGIHNLKEEEKDKIPVMLNSTLDKIIERMIAGANYVNKQTAKRL